MAPRVSSKRRTAAKSANLVSKKKTKKKATKNVVAKSFKTAYNMMEPSKEIRYNFIDHGMEPATSMATRTETLYLDNIAQGTQLNQRLQNKVHISYVHLDGTIQHNSTLKTRAIRLMIVREVNLGGLDLATLANLYKNIGTASLAPAGTQADLQWPINREVAYPVWQKVYRCKPEAEDMTYVKLRIRINRYARYTPNSSADTSPYHGRLILVANVADCDNSPTTTTTVLNIGVRVFFKDVAHGR